MWNYSEAFMSHSQKIIILYFSTTTGRSCSLRGICISRPFAWPPTPALAPNLYLPALAPNLYLPALAPNLYLPALVPNVC